MAPAGHLNERLPYRIDEVVLDEQMPEAVRPLIEIGHRNVERDGLPLFGPATPDRAVREQTLIDPCVPLFEFFGSHVFRPEDCVSRVVESPVAMQDASLSFHLAEERRGWIRCQDVERGALQAVFLDPLGGANEHVFAVVIESQHEGSVDLNSIVMKHADAPRVVGSLWCLLMRISKVVIRERLESDEHAGAACQRHVPDEDRKSTRLNSSHMSISY